MAYTEFWLPFALSLLLLAVNEVQSQCNTGAIRLVGGSVPNEGRVEVCIGGWWGTVCDNSWSISDARVVCKQLGYSTSGATYFLNAYFGEGSGSILMSNVRCGGTQHRLYDCPYSYTNNCEHGDDASVRCSTGSPCSTGAIRLAGGSVPNEGRVEVCIGGEWGTVCDDLWSQVDARVVCKQLGYATSGSGLIHTAYGSAQFGEGTGDIVMDDVACGGSELWLYDCPHTSQHNCRHREDASVLCSGCTTGAVRLMGGNSAEEGRVEVCVNSQWGTVCDDSWSNTDAQVVCRQLGYATTGSTAYSSAYYGQGRGDILMDDVACRGTESRLSSCSHVTNHNCGHSEDASVKCQVRTSTGLCTRSVSRVQTYSVYVTTSRTTYTSCWWSRCSETVYSSSLQYRTRVAYISQSYCCSGYSGSGTLCTPICSRGCGNGRCIGPGRCSCKSGWSGTTCQTPSCNLCLNGRCSSPGRCTCNSGWTGSRCQTAICSPPCVNGRCSSQRRCTCNSGWTGNTCQTPICSGGCGNGRCTSPRRCTCNRGWAGISCVIELCPGREGEVRLAGGTRLSGRVEVCVGGQWGTVCNGYWSDVDASVACYQLGFSRNSADGFTFRTPGVGPIHMDDVHCTGSEARLSDCPHSSHLVNCRHTEDAGATCQQRVCDDGAVQLVSSEGVIGGSVMKGRVEVCWNETWGTVCDQNWSPNDAKVICGQLGYLQSGASSYSDALLGQGNGPIFFNDVNCVGSEASLVNCTSDPIGVTDPCTHADDAGVRCRSTLCTNGDLFLVDGLSDNEGRLEMCYNNRWGTVCDDSWTQGSTEVACRQLGIQDSTHVSRLQNNMFSRASSNIPIFLDDVVCTGSETNLLSCQRNLVFTHNCGHSEDISLRCGQCSEYDVRLVDGGSQNEGRVEVCVSGRWGTVCDDGWTTYDARVVCRQLGYQTSGVQALSGTSFSPNFSLPIVMDAVACNGREASLGNCTYRNSTNLRFCSHREDARIRCRLSAPGPPQSVRASSITSSSLAIFWSHPSSIVPAPAPVSRYSVRCSASGKPTRSVQTSSGVSTSITIAGLRPYTRYSCCVAAETSVGNGNSSCISPRTNEAAPGPPQSIAGVPTSSRSISLTWQPPSILNGIIREYCIHITEQDTAQSWQLTSRYLEQSITGLHPYYNYLFRVAAVTVAEGPYSAPDIQIRTYQDVPSGSPSNLVSTDVTSTSFTLMWHPPSLQSHNGIIRHYTLRLENVVLKFIAVPSSSLSYSAVGLSPYTLYECSVAVRTINGTGPYSSKHSVRTSEDAPSASPVSTTHTVQSPTSLILRWSPPSPQYRNGVIRHYSIQMNDTAGERTATGTSYAVENLHPYYIYEYSVAAFTISLGPYSAPQSVRMPQTSPSGSPLNFRATQKQLTSVTLVWQPPHPYQQNGVITNYTVHITPPGQSPYTVVTTELLLTVSSLLGNTLYSFAVAASTVVGRGPYTSPSVTVQTLSPDFTSPPLDVTVIVVDHERLHVTWTPPPFSEQSGDIINYTVRVTEVDTGRTWEDNANLATLWTLSNLHPYYTYDVQVKAVPTSGTAAYSDTVSGRTLPIEPSGAPTITYTETTTHSVLLRWSSLPPHQHNGVLSGYIINYLKDGVQQSVSVASHILEYIIEAVPYTEYVLKVAAVNSVGQGPFSSIVEIRTPEDRPTHHPRNLLGVALSSTSISLSWNPPPDEHHNGEIDSYTVLCTEVNTGGSLSQHSTPTTNITIDGLHPYYTYKCNVSAVTVDHGPYSAIISVTTFEDAPTGPPRNLVANEIGTDFVSLSWTLPEASQQNGIIRHYLIYLTHIISPSSNKSYSTPSSSTSHTLTGLLSYTSYRIVVAAVTTAAGPRSNVIEVQTAQDIPSASSESLTLIPLSPYNLSITWQAPPMEARNGEIKYYAIKVMEEETTIQTWFNTTDNSTFFNVDTLHPYYHYNVNVAAVTVGIGPFSIQTSVRMPATAPSSPPQETMGRPLSSTSIHMQWDPPPAQHHNGLIESYVILCMELDTDGAETLHTTRTTSITISGLHPFYTYNCNVSAVTVDDGPFSDTISITTLEDVPSAPPYNLLIEGIGSSNISLSWSEPDTHQRNGIIHNYLIYLIPNQPWLQANTHIAPASAHVLYTVRGLHPNTTYTISVTAVTIAPGPNSTEVLAQTVEDVPSAPPMELSIIPLTARNLSVSWQAPPKEMQNGMIRYYTIQTLEVATGALTYWNTSLLNFTVESLHPFYEYQVSVAAATVGLGPFSPEMIVIMLEAEPSGPPTITITEAAADSIYLHWSPPALENQNGIITGYIIDFSSGQNDSRSISVETVSTEYTLVAIPYTNYSLRVAAVNSAGQGPFSSAVNVETLQDAPSHGPTSFRGVTLSSSSIQLEWEPPPPQYWNGIIVSYVVLCTESGSEGVLKEYITTTTNITINELHPFYTYNCSVSAVTVDQGPFSSIVSITTFEDAPSGRPYNPTVVETTPHSISLSWTEPDPSLWNGIIRHYLIYLTPIESSSFTITYSTLTPTSSTSFNITELHPHTSYHIRVAAVTIAPGPNSTLAITKTGEYVPSAPPQDVSANPISVNNLTVTWRAPPRDKRNGEIRYYNIAVLEVATGSQSWYITSDSSTHWIVKGLHPYYAYQVSVAAVTVGLGPFSHQVAVRMPEAAPTRPPSNLTLVERGSSYILLQWLPPLPVYHNGIIDHYLINLKDGNSSETVLNLITPTSQPSVHIGALQSDRAYTCSVAAVTVSPGPFSSSISFTTESDVPGAVQSLLALALSPQSINISWQPPLEEERGGEIIDYHIDVTHFKGNGDAYVTSTVSTSVVVYSLHPNYIYQCSVASRTSEGLGPLTHTLLRLPPDIPIGYPQNIGVVASDSNTLHIYWNPPPLEKQNGNIMQYGINITDVESGKVTQHNTSNSSTSYIVPGLLPYHFYKYTVTAFTVVGHGPYSPIQTVQMPAAAPTSAPFNMTLEELGSTYALIRWSAPLENEHNGVIQYYIIYLNTSVEVGLNVTTAGSESYILLDILKPNTGYTCTVAAVTVSPGPASTALLFTTNIAAPETVQSLMATALSPRSLNISWKPPLNEETTGPILEYHVNISALNGNRESQIIVTTSTNILVDMLHPGSIYLCIVASMSDSRLQQSTGILVEMPPDVPSGSPQNVMAVASDSSTLHVTWSPPRLEQQNGNIIQYGINITNIQSGEVTQFIITSDLIASLTIPQLHPHYYYKYTVTAFTSVGNGPYSPPRSIQMPQDVPSGSPINITVINVYPGTISLLWLPPPVEKQNGDITGYVIRLIDLEHLVKTEHIIDSAATRYAKEGLKTAHHYNLSVAAVTIKGWGPFSYPVSIVTLHGVPSPPTVGGAERITATQIRFSWTLHAKIEESMPIAYYTVKYLPLSSDLRSRRTVEHNAQFINTTKSSVIINGLIPILAYTVAVAANTDAGTGTFSNEITVGLSENNLFQLFISGAIDCQEWVLYHIDAKLESTKSELSTELERSCRCQFSADYILFNQPQCISAHTNWLILWGRVVGTNSSNSTDILKQLQVWSDTESKVIVEGVHLTALKFCSVSLKEGEHPFCETPPPVTEDGSPQGSSEESTSFVTYIIVGIVVFMLVMILGTLVCIGTLLLYKKRKVRDRQMRFHSAHPLNTLDRLSTPSDSANFKYKGDDDSNIYEQADSLYETIMDDLPYAEVSSQVPPSPDFDELLMKSQPQSAAEPQNAPSKNDIAYSQLQHFPFEDNSQCCPVECTVLKPSTSVPPDYSIVAKKGCKHARLESTEDYVPMFDEEKFFEAEKPNATYQTLSPANSDAENVYQRPRMENKMKIKGDGKEKEKEFHQSKFDEGMREIEESGGSCSEMKGDDAERKDGDNKNIKEASEGDSAEGKNSMMHKEEESV